MLPDPTDNLSQAFLFELVKKLTLRPVMARANLVGRDWELVGGYVDMDGQDRDVVVARGTGDTPLHALSDMAINIANDDPFGELDADEGGEAADGGPQD